ncbi:MAG TPA: winged helix-turn-helix domain-containing protein [Pseudolabrys sp.]|uniref:winged helix-turn-helix domain-containing protein n=1 Tax=Pseudolabrys sp. TaxID=1960880 RepID=UPI002DDDAD6D|nr:winged helix-turn-helix domain-containing protein [Pseudolabrys sp.]HEV2630235.1 winged helix-turn-helix domain-containing protein [Pseudolabrys sp.]
MDAYLKIAIEVLEGERRPLSPKAILETAYRRSLVPTHLHGKTQHKTLQARISEDIVERREHSLFFRTEPGRFFLRKFLTDRSVPTEFRSEFPARRRVRELVRGPALALEYDLLKEIAEQDTPIDPQTIFAALASDKYQYDDPRNKSEKLVFVRSFVCVYRGCDLLSYRLGRYRDDRDTFMSHRSIGFSTFVNIDDQTLFNLGTLGIVEAGVSATKIDLDIPESPVDEQLNARLSYFIWAAKGSSSSDLLAVIDFECPGWFEPLRRRLALNDLGWLDASKPVNDVSDFDPWSRLVLLAHYRSHMAGGPDFETDSASTERRGRRVSQVSN